MAVGGSKDGWRRYARKGKKGEHVPAPQHAGRHMGIRNADDAAGWLAGGRAGKPLRPGRRAKRGEEEEGKRERRREGRGDP